MTLTEQWWAIYNDLKGKLSRQDWHGVRDACVDLEICETKMRLKTIAIPVP